MAEHIRIDKAAGTWVVRAGGAVIGETGNALEMTEGSRAPLIYFPRESIAMAFLDRIDKTTTCPHRGEAAHFEIVTQSARIPEAAWSYERPMPEVAAIAGYLAFHDDRVTVECL